MKVLKKKISNTGILFISLITIYVILMTVTYSIPNSQVETKVADSMVTFDKEGDYLLPFGENRAARLDNFTDRIMIDKTIKNPKESIVQSAMSIDGYARYWHGYQIIVRPLISIMNYSSIRYLNLFFIVFLLCYAFKEINKEMGFFISIFFLASLAMIYVFIFPMSLQFTSVFVLSMIGIILLIQLKQVWIKHPSLYIYYFFIIGSITNFFDLLTAPLLTLGLLLVITFLLENSKEKINGFKSNFYLIFENSLFWTLGYGLTWGVKWVLASIILKQNIIKDALDKILFRTTGDADSPVNRIETIQMNFDLMFPSLILKLFVGVFVIWLVIFFFYHKQFKEILKMTPLLLVSLYPYIWYFLLANHSQLHAWFTYRIQSITVFSIMTFLVLCIDIDKISNKIHNNYKKSGV